MSSIEETPTSKPRLACVADILRRRWEKKGKTLEESAEEINAQEGLDLFRKDSLRRFLLAGREKGLQREATFNLRLEPVARYLGISPETLLALQRAEDTRLQLLATMAEYCIQPSQLAQAAGLSPEDEGELILWLDGETLPPRLVPIWTPSLLSALESLKSRCSCESNSTSLNASA